MKQILSDSRREKFAYNEDKFLRVSLDSNQGMLPVSEMTSSVNEYHQYFAEHNASNIYRLIFTINPICSNVLFNNITEIVYNEGSDKCVFFGKNGIGKTVYDNLPKNLKTYNENMKKSTGLTRYDLIEDTTYSHAKIGPLVYHCGSDIFNNHTLRRKEFTVVNKTEKNAKNASDFNTIKDFLRDRHGKVVIDYRNRRLEEGEKSTFSRHLYTSNTVKTFPMAMDDNLIEQNGWFGYKNPISLNINNLVMGEEPISINKCMNNNKAGEFIDMYPDRSLYSFLPKYNKYRDRQEYNWEYCLTYPYKNYYDNELITVDDYNGLECVPIQTSNIILDDENKVIQFKTYIRHNLTTSNKVRIALFDSGDTFLTETTVSIQVVEIGNGGYDGDHYFSVRLSDIMTLMNRIDDPNPQEETAVGNGIITPTDLKNYKFRFAKYVNGCRCKYYFRKFRKLPNFFGTDIYQDENITDADIEKVIKGKKQVFNTTLNKMAFAENIFSDKLAEIVFNDDINTTGLKDNLGRALSEIYLTIVKTNYGHEKWYNLKGPNYTDSDIEFSHCFSKVTAGLDMENGKLDYNVHTLHNINIKTTSNAPYIPEPGKAIESNITVSHDEFFGDLVELSPYTLEETTLEKVYHRFNTAQREFVSDEFKDIHYDDIVFDDFDIPQEVDGRDFKTFTVRKAPYCTVGETEDKSKGKKKSKPVTQKTFTREITDNDFPGNLAPEGYYYQAHYKIKLRDYSSETSWGSNQRVVFSIPPEETDEGNIYHIETAKNYYFNVKDPVILYNKNTMKRLGGEIASVEGKYYTEISIKAELEEEKTLKDYLLFKVNPIRPSTAYDLDDGTGRYVWRDFLPAEEMTPDNELYDVPFVNGAHYIHKNINFYVRRQDPYGLYGLSFGLEKPIPLPLMNLIVPGNEKDVDKFDYIENTGKTC